MNNHHYVKGKVPSDAPTTFKAPGFSREKRAEREALQARYDELCGPVAVTKVAEAVGKQGV